jgi:SAM-dependent methyltransferase
MNDEIKTCCAALYESDLARLLLGDSFHPGGLRLTQRLGEILELGLHSRVLDVASGKGESALFLAEHFGREVVGIDFGIENVRHATERAGKAGVGHLVRFEKGDAEKIAYSNASFDALICECAFCTFPDKRAAARELARVLRPQARIGLSDLTKSANLPAELQGMLAWVACIADARPVEEYVEFLRAAGFDHIQVESHDEALTEMVRAIQGKLLSTELMSKLNRLDLSGVDFAQAKQLVRAASDAVRAGALGYATIMGSLK